jgi:hypothetical protein
MRIICRLLLLYLIGAAILLAQIEGIEVRINYLRDFDVYYLSDLDFNNAVHNADVFSFTISYLPPSSASEFIELQFEYEIYVDIPSLGLENRRLFYLLTEPILFGVGSLTLTSQNLDLNMDGVCYDSGNLLGDLEIAESELMPDAEFYTLQQVVIGSGQMPAGRYLILFNVVHNGCRESVQHVFEVSNPTALTLIAPGGTVDDQQEIFTLFPLFQWESVPLFWDPLNCPDCGYGIRVAQYDEELHSSFEDALADQASLPFDDTGGYYPIPTISSGMGSLVTSANSFQYPSFSASPLEYGKNYVWQIRKTYKTTSGPESTDSEIYGFKIADLGESKSLGVATPTLIMELLGELLEGQQFDALLHGELKGFTPTGVFVLDDSLTLSSEDVVRLLNELNHEKSRLKSVRIE